MGNSNTEDKKLYYAAVDSFIRSVEEEKEVQFYRAGRLAPIEYLVCCDGWLYAIARVGIRQVQMGDFPTVLYTKSSADKAEKFAAALGYRFKGAGGEQVIKPIQILLFIRFEDKDAYAKIENLKKYQILVNGDKESYKIPISEFIMLPRSKNC